MANRENDLIFEKYKETKQQVNEDLGLGPMMGRIMKLAGDLNNDMSPPAKVTVHIAGMKEDEEDDRISSFMKLQKAKEKMLKVKAIEDHLKKSPLGRAVGDESKSKEQEDGETVYIQAGMPESDCGDDCECNDCSDDPENYDGEIDMARLELLKANEYAAKLFGMVAKHENLEGWVASKITKASDYLSSVYHYLDYNDNFDNIEDAEDEDEDIEFDDFRGTDTAKNVGFAAAESEEGNRKAGISTSPGGTPLSEIMKRAQPYIKDLVEKGITDPGRIYYILTNTYAVDGIPHHLEENPYFLKRVREMVAKLQGKTPKSGLTDSPYDPVDENDEGQSNVNDELMQRYYEEGIKKGLKGQKLKDYIENMMTQPGPHG